jgi:hypothetical protein
MTGQVELNPAPDSIIDSDFQFISDRLDLSDYVGGVSGRLFSCIAQWDQLCELVLLPSVEYDAQWGFPRTMIFQSYCLRGCKYLYLAEYRGLSDLLPLPVDPTE